MDYNFTEIEKKWQAYWAKHKTFRAENNSDKPKYYVLDMFPYPSGAGLHVGHPLGYIASDIMARFKRHQGFNVLHPMGYDSFGLPAEQYAIQTGQHPAITTEQNIARYREQLDKIGFSFDWEREVRTSDPEYYKWTQWIFIQLFKAWYNPRNNKTEPIDTLIKIFETEGFKGLEHDILTGDIEQELKAFTPEEWKQFSEKKKSEVLMNFRIAYLGEAYVNWCPALGTVLANDEVKDGVSERGGYPVERKLMKQWSMRITAYAQRLLDGLESIDWTESLKESQRYWIGRSEGTSLKFSVIQPHPKSFSKGEGLTPGWKTADPSVYALLKKYARQNRQPLTETEDVLWQALRNRKFGAKFRRQHPIGTYIADFICLDHRFIIEVDGKIHDQQKEYDKERTNVLNLLGFEVIRFSNEEVQHNLQAVLDKIKTKLAESHSPRERGQGGEAEIIEVFTTRPDTIFGVSFVTLAPEHELVNTITTAEKKTEVGAYVSKSKNRSERERQSEIDKISGVFTGAYVTHPFSGKSIPVWVGDYVLAGYGTGAVMAVPAHDERDYRFATHFGLEKPQVIAPSQEHDFSKASWDEKEGQVINSDFLNGLNVKSAINKAVEEIEKKGIGKRKVNYRLRDAVFGRQRYWGEPIPVYYKDGIPQVLDEKELPLVLPEVDKFLPTEDGEPPLARANNWKYKGEYAYEHTTMPGWAGSSWYYLRYMDANNNKQFVSQQSAEYWKNVDLYIGGSEHATGHLLYVRFWTKALFDLGHLPFDEPMQKLINQGMIQGTSAIVHRSTTENKIISAGLKSQHNTTEIHIDVNLVENNTVNIESLKKWRDDFATIEFELENGKLICSANVEKMSKRWYNVVTPDSICERFGADTLRLYEMFLGPLEQSKPWNTNGITGVSGFLKKLWRLYHSTNGFEVSEAPASKAELKTLHKTIKKISEDIERFSFNTSVSSFMICVNELGELKCSKKEILEPLLVLLSPYAPHITEELWEKLGHKTSIALAPFPVFKTEYLVEDSFVYPISFNGKMRLNIELPASLTVTEIEKEVMSREEVQKHLNGASPKKVIVVPRKIVNIVI
jgi:leucyl-tRNA synthetase